MSDNKKDMPKLTEDELVQVSGGTGEEEGNSDWVWECKDCWNIWPYSEGKPFCPRCKSREIHILEKDPTHHPGPNKLFN